MSTCIVCNEVIVRKPGMSEAKYAQRRTCGKTDCRIALSKVSGRPETGPLPVAEIDAPYPRQVHYARHSATEAELRLVAPAIRAAVWGRV